MKTLYEYLTYTNTAFNIIPNEYRTGITNNILPYHVDYNVMLWSGGRALPLNNLFFTSRFNGYCVHADCRDTLIPQRNTDTTLSINDITLHIIDQLWGQFNRNLPWGGQELPGIPHIYPFLSGYDVDFMARTYELANNQDETTFNKNNPDWTELSADYVAENTNRFPWSGFGEIIYYNPKRKLYEMEQSSYAGKTPLTPIPELIQFSQENKKHPLVQIHYWIGNDEAFNDLLGWAQKNPDSNIILCHGGYEMHDNVEDWLQKISQLPNNVLVEVSWILLDLLYIHPELINELPVLHYIYGSDTTPYDTKDGHDIDLEIDKLVQVSSLMHNPRLDQPLEGNQFWPAYKVPNS